MAIVLGTPIRGYSGNNITGGTFTTGTYTIPANTLVIVHLEIGHSTSLCPTVHGLSGMGLTWNTLFSCMRDANGFSGGSGFYAQTGASSVTGTLTITFSAGTTANRGIHWDVQLVTGHDTTTPIRASNKTQTNGSGQFATITLPQTSPGSTDNRVFYYVARPMNTNTVQVAANWTALSTVNDYSLGDIYQVAWVPTGYQQTAQPNFVVATATWQGFAYEVQAGASMTTVGPSADAAATFTEQQPNLNVSTTDTGTLAEATSTAATAPAAADTATATEAATVYVPVSQADTGYLDESAFLSSVAFVAADTATATDAATVSAADAGTDTAQAAEQATTGATVDGADLLTGVDAGNLVILVTAPDRYLSDADAAANTDAATLAAALAGVDTAAGTEAATVAAEERYLVSDADTAAGADAATGQVASIGDTETAFGTETAGVVDAGHADLVDADGALFTDAADLAGYLTDADVATAAEAIGGPFELRYLSAADTAAGVDEQSVAVSRQGADGAAGAEAASLFELLRPLSDSDLGRLRDRITIAQLINPGSEQSTLLGGEDGGFAETAAVVVIASGSADHGGLTDAATVTVLSRAPFVIRPVAASRYVDRPGAAAVIRSGVQVVNRP